MIASIVCLFVCLSGISSLLFSSYCEADFIRLHSFLVQHVTDLGVDTLKEFFEMLIC